MSTPNILLILTDQQRTDSLGAYGGGFVPTPHLDSLARQGTVFERCYVDNPICTPSRSSIWTGKTVFGHGVHNLHDVLSATDTLFPFHLQARGYCTALFGKLHVSARVVDQNERHPRAGFDLYEAALSPYNHDCKYHAYRDWLRQRDPGFLARLQREGSAIGHIPACVHFSTWIAERTEDFISRQSLARPFFCCASFVDPHDPYDDHPAESLAAVNLGHFDHVARGPVSALRPEGVKREEAACVLGSIDEYSDQQIVRMRRSYYAAVGFLDTSVGRILQALRRSGLDRQTLILFASDHGDMLGQRRLLGKGGYFYEQCARVPLLMREPEGRNAGRRSKALVQLHDLAATVLAAASYDEDWRHRHMPASEPLQTMAVSRDCVFAVYRNSCINRQKQFWDPPINCTMARTATHKLTVYHDGPPTTEDDGELYDMVADPEERKNLWCDTSTALVRNDLLSRMTIWLAREQRAGPGGRGGHAFPAPEHWLKNNPIRIDR